MKANEFFKKVGIEAVKSYIVAYEDHLTDELKRLVESHELVEYMGGIDKAKEQAYVLAMEVDGFNPAKVEKAITDVEGCVEVSSESN
ncbi:hypothetical protein [Acinetobacter pseudolwoffii]|uniref:hypothetical protein n=1 Tax=Acinetobacter pseudolwoffii TaxID=2053287 RepID=UPI0025779F1A|nr:hypothetical protein [Acinetobacter pseudolwoffii]MDM1324904.1 hypothetical protein [Acinetobacter pseudolwoffii]